MEDPTILAERYYLMSVVEKIMEHNLKPRERMIVRYRFGLDSGIRKSIENVAYEYSISRSRVHQIEKKSLIKIREALQTRGWTGEMINQLFD